MRKPTFRRVLKAINNYVVFFLVVAFAVTCCMLVFVHTLAGTMGLVFTEENITAAAKVTFLNVLLLTLLFGTIDYIRRRLMVDRPVKLITAATENTTVPETEPPLPLESLLFSSNGDGTCRLIGIGTNTDA